MSTKLIKRKKYSPIQNSYSSMPNTPTSNESDKKEKKKRNIIKLIKERETIPKKAKSTIFDTINFPFVKNVMTFYKVFNVNNINEYDIKNIFDNKNLKLYRITKSYKEDNKLLFEEFDSIYFNSDNYKGQHTEYSEIRDDYFLLYADLIAANIRNKKSETIIANSVDFEDFLLTDKNFNNLYYINYNNDIFDELNELYKELGFTFKLSDAAPIIPKNIPGIDYKRLERISGSGLKKSIKILYKNKEKKVYKNEENYKYIKHENKKILLKDIKNKYKYV